MGANGSHAGSQQQRGQQSHPDGKSALASHYILKPGKKGGSSQGKPSPPSQPQAQEMTHNSITLSWSAPRHNSGNKVFAYTVEIAPVSEASKSKKSWTVLTKCCQGNSYQAKNLKADTDYVFRVRAENIHGTSKASRPSENISTKIYEVEDVYSPHHHSHHHHHQEKADDSQDGRLGKPLRRRHSINLHLEGGVTSILNHTDISVKATEPKLPPSSASSTQELDKDGNEIQGQGHNSRGSHSGSRPSTLQRDAALRSSLQSWSRKRSLPILLPGTKTNSLMRLRDSQTFPNIKARAAAAAAAGSDGGGGGVSTDSMKRREMLGLRARSSSDARASSSVSSCSGSREDVTDTRSSCSSSTTTTEEDLKNLNHGKGGSMERESKRNSLDRDSWRDSRNSERDSKRDSRGSDRDSKRDSKRDSRSSSERDSRIEEEEEEEEEDGKDSYNPWEKDDSVNEVTERIRSAPFCDDTKTALYARSVPENGEEPGYVMARNFHTAADNEGGQADFRTLNRLLHSDEVLVKPTRSLPDVANVGKANSLPRSITIMNNNNNNNNNLVVGKGSNNKLTTILDEEEESVRVTTL